MATKYRFKTREEFIQEFGDDWRNEKSLRGMCYFSPEMDIYLRTDFQDNLIEKLLKNDFCFFPKNGGYTIREWMLTEKNPTLKTKDSMNEDSTTTFQHETISDSQLKTFTGDNIQMKTFTGDNIQMKTVVGINGIIQENFKPSIGNDYIRHVAYQQFKKGLELGLKIGGVKY